MSEPLREALERLVVVSEATADIYNTSDMDKAIAAARLVLSDDGLECPMCGGEGRIYDITAAIEDAQAAGTVMVPLSRE